VSGIPGPARYEVRVEGVLDERWSEWFQGMEIRSDGAETILAGTLPDQSALHGILNRVWDLGLSVITVRRLPLGEPDDLTRQMSDDGGEG
jgi:hypothetical protein